MGVSLSGYDVTDDNTVIDVVEDLAWYTWISLIWLGALVVLAIVTAAVEWSNLLKTKGTLRTVYLGLTALESHEQAEAFLDALGLGETADTDDWTQLGKNGVAICIRGATSLVREGFFIFVAAVSAAYAYVTLMSHQGPCLTSTTQAGRCSVQNAPVPRIEIILVVLLSILSRVASSYNYTDGNWNMALGRIHSSLGDKINSLDLTAIGNRLNVDIDGTTKKVLRGISNHITSTTIQGLAMVGAVVGSLGVTILVGSAYFSIDEKRRFPFQAIAVTLLVLEIIFMVLNVVVWLASSTQYIRNATAVKFYIEGKLWGALYLTAMTLAIYHCSRRAINMYGSPVGLTGLNDHLMGAQGSLGLGLFAGKQLSQPDEWCHYIPKIAFENRVKYSFDKALCEETATQFGTCCSLADFDSDGTNSVTTYTGLWVAIAGMVLQVLSLLVSAMFYGNSPVSNAVDNTVNSLLPAKNGLQRGFKTIQVV